MKKTCRIYQVDSFTRERFTGNPAGVVSNADGLSEVQMQRIAREMNNSETAFVLSDKTGESDVHVRFFTPTREVPICGHATVAAHYVRALEGRLGNTKVFQRTGAGILPVEILSDGDDYRIVMTQGKIAIGSPFEEVHLSKLVKALGIEAKDLRSDCPVVIASTGHSKVMVAIHGVDLLHRLSPEMSQLSDLSEEIGCNGYYVFTLHPGESPLIHGRMFAPAIGIAEDPVTGNANGPLGAYLVHFGIVENDGSELSFDVVQGEAMGRPGTMKVAVSISDGKPVGVKISGEAVVAFSTEIEID